MRIAPLPVLVCLLLTTVGSIAGPPAPQLAKSPSCEPAGSIDFSAKTIALSEGRASVTAIVELTVVSQVDLIAARVQGSRATPRRPQASFLIRKNLGSLPRRVARKIQHEIILEPGREHHLTFTFQAQEPTGRLRETTSYLRVNLDPRLEPEVMDDLVQFRARMEER
jgi:hypothetical protein